MTKPRRHEPPLSNDARVHLVITLPPDDADTLLLLLREKFGFTRSSDTQHRRDDGSTVSVL